MKRPSPSIHFQLQHLAYDTYPVSANSLLLTMVLFLFSGTGREQPRTEELAWNPHSFTSHCYCTFPYCNCGYPSLT